MAVVLNKDLVNVIFKNYNVYSLKVFCKEHILNREVNEAEEKELYRFFEKVKRRLKKSSYSKQLFASKYDCWLEKPFMFEGQEQLSRSSFFESSTSKSRRSVQRRSLDGDADAELTNSPEVLSDGRATKEKKGKSLVQQKDNIFKVRSNISGCSSDEAVKETTCILNKDITEGDADAELTNSPEVLSDSKATKEKKRSLVQQKDNSFQVRSTSSGRSSDETKTNILNKDIVDVIFKSNNMNSLKIYCEEHVFKRQADDSEEKKLAVFFNNVKRKLRVVRYSKANFSRKYKSWLDETFKY